MSKNLKLSIALVAAPQHSETVVAVWRALAEHAPGPPAARAVAKAIRLRVID